MYSDAYNFSMTTGGLAAFPAVSETLVSLSAEYPHRRFLAPPPIAARILGFFAQPLEYAVHRIFEDM